MNGNGESLISYGHGHGFLYGHMKAPWLRPAWDILQTIELKRGERILLLPARTGELLARISSFHVEGSITGVEPNLYLLEQARELIASLEVERTEKIELLHGPISSVPCPGAQDALLGHFLFPMVKEISRFAQSVKRNLRPGGRFAIQMPIEGFSPFLEEAFMESLGNTAILPNKPSLCMALKKATIEKGFKEAGFRRLEFVVKVYLQNFDTPSEAGDFLFSYGGWPGMEGIDNDTRERLVHEIGIRLCRSLHQGKDIEIPFKRLIIYGTR